MARKQSAQRKTHTPDPGNTRRWRSVRRQIDALDVATFNAIAGTKSPLLDATMPRLTRAADRSVLWIAIAGLMALSGRARARLGAARGLVSIAITSLIANQVSKRIHRRPRPSITQVPAQRLAHRIPESTSFPSGHSASAMAFAAGASAEWPALSVPLRTLAGLVGFSRVATGASRVRNLGARARINALARQQSGWNGEKLTVMEALRLEPQTLAKSERLWNTPVAAPHDGDAAFRLWGGGSGSGGGSWSGVDPTTMSSTREMLGLPNVNTMDNLSLGVITDASQVQHVRHALPLDGMPGGGAEWVFRGGDPLDFAVGRVTLVDVPFAVRP